MRNPVVIFLVALLVGSLLLYGLYRLWLRIRPRLLTPPWIWPKKAAYARANKQFENILFWPTKLGVAGDIWIINLWLASFLLVPFMLPVALPVWLINGLPNHWFWFRLSERRNAPRFGKAGSIRGLRLRRLLWIVPTVLVVVIAALVIIDRWTQSTGPLPPFTPTPIPPTLTPSPILPTLTPTPTRPAATPLPATETAVPPISTAQPFAIRDEAFEADYEGECDTDVDITSVDGNSFGIRARNVAIREGRMTIWCYGALHTWIGELTYAGHAFASSEDDPLQFTVDEESGYLYTQGAGTVTLPNGTAIRLPQGTGEGERSASEASTAAAEQTDLAVTPRTRRGHIADLVAQGDIGVEATGSGIDELELDIENLIEELLDVEIPAGTYFVSGSAGVQNMVVRQTKVVQVKPGELVDLVLEVACASMERDVPSDEHSFAIQRQGTEELARLMPTLEEANVPYDVEQAAIWIVSDNADYADLGTLVSGLGQARAIHEEEAAQAMRLVHEAGIDITARRIWADRQRIATGADAGFESWMDGVLRERGRTPTPTVRPSRVPTDTAIPTQTPTVRPRRTPTDTPIPTPMATRDVSTLERALLGHWVTESGVTHFYIGPGTMIMVEPSGTMHLTWSRLEGNDEDNWMKISIYRPDTGGGHVKLLRFAPDRLSLVSETNIAQTWLYVDGKQQP